jgi:hypothetical protein
LRPRTSRLQPLHLVLANIATPHTPIQSEEKNEEEKKAAVRRPLFFFISIKAIPKQLFS